MMIRYSVVGPDKDIQSRGSFALDEVYALDGGGLKVPVPSVGGLLQLIMLDLL